MTTINNPIVRSQVNINGFRLEMRKKEEYHRGEERGCGDGGAMRTTRAQEISMCISDGYRWVEREVVTS